MDNKGKKEHTKGGFASGSSREGSSEKEDTGDRKEQILREKEQRKIEEQKKKEKALQQIRIDNNVARQKAREKEAQMLRPSSGMKHSFGIQSWAGPTNDMLAQQTSPAEERKAIEEPYSMEDEKEVDDEDEDLENIQEEIEESESEKEENKKDVTLLKTMGFNIKTMHGRIAENDQKIEEEIAELIMESEKLAEPIPEALPKEQEENKVEGAKKDAAQRIEGLIQCLSSDTASGGEEPEGNEEEDEQPPDEDEEIVPLDERRKLEERIKLLRQYPESS